MCWSEKGNHNVLKKYCLQEMSKEYCRQSEAGINVMQ